MKKHEDFWVPWLIVWGISIVFISLICTLCYFLCTSPECNHNFILAKIVIQLFVVATSIIGVIYNIIDYVAMNKQDDKTVKMKFKLFKDIYHVNPNRWSIYHGRLSYDYDEPCSRRAYYYVAFSYFDWLKFLIWNKVDEYREHLELKREREKAHDNRMAEMLKFVQMDINKVYEKINNMTNECE